MTIRPSNNPLNENENQKCELLPFLHVHSCRLKKLNFFLLVLSIVLFLFNLSYPLSLASPKAKGFASAKKMC
jgi:hypothetical protein